MSSSNISWKGNSSSAIVPTNSRPFYNGDPALETLARTPFRPNPVKHWRKQLKPYYKTHSKQVSIDRINTPGGSISVPIHESVDCEQNNYQLLNENKMIMNKCNGISIDYDGTTEFANKCIGGSHNVRRSANTVISKNYYSNHSKYLQSRCKTFEQNQSLGAKIGDNEYKSSKCGKTMYDKDSECQKTITHKPNNGRFFQQGATSSSNYIHRKRQQEITNNGASLKNAYGNAPRGYTPFYSGQVSDSAYNIQFVKGKLSDNTMDCYSAQKHCAK